MWRNRLHDPVERDSQDTSATDARGIETLVKESTNLKGVIQSMALATSPRILIAEDSEDTRLLIAAYLQPTGYECELAENGRAAVDKFASVDFDLVLMDLEMPVMDGYIATRKIREYEAQRGGRAVPILAFTSFSGEEYFQRSWDAGCNAHLIKPMDKASLLDAIQQHLKTRGALCIVVPDELKDLAPRYLRSRRADLVALATALDRGDYEAIRVLGHNLKGTGSGYGFAGITVIGRCLEFAAKAKSADQVRAQTASLADYLDRVEVV